MTIEKLLTLIFPAVAVVATAAAQSDPPTSEDTHSQWTPRPETRTDTVFSGDGHFLLPQEPAETDPFRTLSLPASADNPAAASLQPGAKPTSIPIPGLYPMQNRRHSENFSVWAGRQQAFYPGLGEYALMQKGISWQPFGGMAVNAAVVAGKQFFYRDVSGRHLFGTQVNIRYRITNDLQIHLRGQYLIRSGAASPYLPPIFFPGSGAGGSMQYRIGNGTIEGGVQQRFDDNRKNWQTESSGKVSVSF